MGREVAAAIAADVDRLVVAVHRHAARRSEVAALLAQTGVPSPALIVDLRPFLLESERIPVAVVRGFMRFIVPSQTTRILDRLDASETLVCDGEWCLASTGARQFAEATTLMQIEIMDELWRDHAEEVDLAFRVLGPPLRAASQTLPLFGPLRALPEPDASAAYALHHRLTLLRYLRSDHHVAVLKEFGLSLGQAKTVDAAWRDDEPPSEAEAAPGWVDSFRGNLTEPGLRRRLAIEDETNVRVGRAFAGQADGTDSNELAEVLANLPS